MCQFEMPDELGASPYGWHSKAPSSPIIKLLSLAVRKPDGPVGRIEKDYPSVRP